MKKKLFFMKYTIIILLGCFLFSQYGIAQTITKETKKETILTKGIDKKAVNNNSNLSTNSSYFGNSMPAGYVNKTPLNKNGNPVNICNPCAIPNNEADIQDEGSDVTNGGCNVNPELYTTINIGETRCGRINGYLVQGNSFRDLDWYKLTLSAPTTVYFSSYSNFVEGGEMWILTFPCLNSTLITNDISYNGIPKTISASLPAGDYYLVFSTNYSFGPGVGGDYMINVSTVAPGTPDTWCNAPASIPTLSEWGLIILGFVLICMGIYYIRRRNISIS